MNDKEKEIEEMARIIDDNHGFIVSSVETAEALYNVGCRNVKYKVVLSKEEYAKYLKVNIQLAVCQKAVSFLTIELNDYKQRYESLDKKFNQLVVSSCEALAKKSKETAREILSQAKEKMKKVDGAIALNYAFAVINELAKQYGVVFE